MNIKVNNKRGELKTYKSGIKNCPFCNINTDKHKVLWEGEYFYIMENDFPYILGGKHLLVNTKRHILLSKDIKPKEYMEFSKIEKFMDDFYEGSNYYSFIRQSLTNTSRSVEHVHYHYLPGNISPKDIQNFKSYNS